ncbi:uncharacterized protein LOC143178165 [Calliopsis andreniformis]|uniref:uncharacterized protein LOC143178165 n=1 Tax=Calliopsis andreniformis TaxID=337506 RepID=UPI003FCC54D8
MQILHNRSQKSPVESLQTSTVNVLRMDHSKLETETFPCNLTQALQIVYLRSLAPSIFYKVESASTMSRNLGVLKNSLFQHKVDTDTIVKMRKRNFSSNLSKWIFGFKSIDLPCIQLSRETQVTKYSKVYFHYNSNT